MPEPDILIRCDMGGAYGMGHAVRCLALAQALMAGGADSVEFLTLTPALASFVAPFQCYVLPGASEADLVYRIYEITPEIVVFDTKAPFSEFGYRLVQRGSGFPVQGGYKPTIAVVRIDDPQAESDACDLLIAPGAHWAPAHVERLRTFFGERFLYGWDYVMLPEEVTQAPPIPYGQRQQRVVFCAGGSDPDGTLVQMYEWTRDLVLEPQGADVPELVFALPQYWPAPQYPCAGTRAMETVLTPFRRQLLRSAALVVGFLGQTTYECRWYQTPMLCFGRTPEEHQALERLTYGEPSWTLGGGYGLGTPEDFRARVAFAWKTLPLRAAQQHLQQGFMDGRGVERVAEAILAVGGA